MNIQHTELMNEECELDATLADLLAVSPHSCSPVCRDALYFDLNSEPKKTTVLMHANRPRGRGKPKRALLINQTLAGRGKRRFRSRSEISVAKQSNPHGSRKRTFLNFSGARVDWHYPAPATMANLRGVRG